VHYCIVFIVLIVVMTVLQSSSGYRGISNESKK